MRSEEEVGYVECPKCGTRLYIYCDGKRHKGKVVRWS
jgi:predicted RNA-binding Zn-ribbon protein involved in translation (DUF1610 family)